MIKRVISLLLVLVILTGMLPVFARAAEGPTTTVDNGELTVEGTNGFGTLLAEDIAQEQEAVEEQVASGYTLTNLEITGNTATVTYDSLEEATVVVAIYTEDGMQLLTSGKTTVVPEETTATVTIDGEMPQYFMASAYLLDSYDMSPLCLAYDTPLYTKEMQDLLASTAEDYDQDRVLQLEESRETNFAVYAETTKVIEQIEGVNTVTSVDDETNTYVIENADESITSLQEGDVFAYPYGDNEILISKVASITIDGTKATIIGGDVELEEVFSQVKIEGTSDTEDVNVDTTAANDGVTYEGLVSNEVVARSATFALEGGGTVSAWHEFKLDLTEKCETDEADASFSMKGSFKLQITANIKYYITLSRQYIEFKAVPKACVGVFIEGTITQKISLGFFGVSPVPGVYIGFSPKLQLKYSGNINLSVTLKTTIGLRYENGKGFKNLTTTPEVDFKFDVEGTIFFGVDFDPNITMLDEGLAKVGLSASVGVELKAKATGTAYEVYLKDAEDIHTCEECLAVDVTFKAEITGSMKFLDKKWLTVKVDIGSWKVKMIDMYYSVDLDEFGLGSCPNRTYRVTVSVVNKEGKPVRGANVSLQSGEILGQTNGHGVLKAYLSYGSTLLNTTIDGEVVTKRIYVNGPCVARIEPTEQSEQGGGTQTDNSKRDFSDLLELLQPSDIQDMNTIVASGECGKYGDNVQWQLYRSGVLRVFGTGEMAEFDPWFETLWWGEEELIKKVVIEEGVTNIGDNAFCGCSNLVEATISESITNIGDSAFESCSSLLSILIPGSVTRIGSHAFEGCISLTAVTISDGVSSIGSYAFFNCSSLMEISIPGSINIIESYAFSECNKLRTVVALSGITSIGDSAFENCSSLTTITLPGSVTNIGDRAFSDCCKLIEITIPNSVTHIGSGAFEFCANLMSVIIPDGVTSIRDYTFYSCSSLQTITLPEGITAIEDYVFMYCNDLMTINIPDSVTSIGIQAFYNCQSLTSIAVKDGVTDIGRAAFALCSNLVEITLPNSITNIGSYMFHKCINLKKITIPNGVTNIGDHAFLECINLTTVTIPNSVTLIETQAFSGCSSIVKFSIPNSVTRIEGSAFSACSSLTSIVLPTNVTSIEVYTFKDCGSLTSITIPNSVVEIGWYVFGGCDNLTNIYYTGTPEQWDAISVDTQNEPLYKANIHYNSTVSATMVTGNDMPIVNGSLSGQIGNEMSCADAVFGGEYGMDIVDGVIVKTVVFSGLVAEEEYVLLSLVSVEVEDPLSTDNLLFVDQAVANENGELSFRYVQRVNTERSYVMACGASNKDLNNAVITFPKMIADGEIQVVQPTVVYEGKTLTEGRDYVITGDADFTEVGEYTCNIRGIYNYTGLVTCTYQVRDIIQPTLTLKAPALEFKDMICVVAFYTAENIDDVVEMGMITYTEKVDVVDINTAAHVIPGASYDEITGRYFSSSQGIHAKYLGDTVYLACYAKLSDGAYVYTKLAPYSPITYATNQLKNSTNTQLKQLVAAMLNYGTEAQLYFGHNVDTLANACMTAEQLALPEVYHADMVGSVPTASATKQGVFSNNKGFTVRKPAISFEGAFCINYFFTPAYTPVDGITLYYWNEADFNAVDVLAADNATGAVAMEGSGTEQYRGDIEGIAAKSLSEAMYVVAVYSDGTTTWTSGVLGYSIGAYCSNQSNASSAVAALAEATAVYGYHAKQYFGS